MEALRAVVSGLVQGVGYRYFAQRQADALALSGYVRNQPSGQVEIVAEGERPALEQLLAALHHGPRSAIVRSVTVVWSETSGTFTGFEVR